MSTVTFLILEAIGYPTPQAAVWPAMFTPPPPPPLTRLVLGLSAIPKIFSHEG